MAAEAASARKDRVSGGLPRVDIPGDSPYTPPNLTDGLLRGRGIEVVMIRAENPDPLEFHRVGLG